jgi:membrane peptidoglycan carboxypeptidase
LDIVKVDDEDRQNPDYKGMSDDKILEHKRTHLADLIDSQLPLLGLEIETTLDAKAQKIAEATFHTEMEKMRNDGNMKMEGVKGSVLITSNKEENPASIVAWVGGDNFKEDQVDWVEAKRQVGSMMKELVYAVAMEQGIISDINSTKYTSLRD